MKRAFLLLILTAAACGGDESGRSAPPEPSAGQLRLQRAIRQLQSGPATPALCADIKNLGDLAPVPADVQRKCGEAPVASLRATYDEVDGITTYRDPAIDEKALRNQFSLYFTERKNGVGPLMMHFIYYGESIIDPVSYKSFADGRTYENWIRFHGAQYRRQHHGLPLPAGPPYYDTADEKVMKGKELELIRAMASAKKAIVRYVGVHDGDHQLTPEEQHAITNVLTAWEAKGGKVDFP